MDSFDIKYEGKDGVAYVGESLLIEVGEAILVETDKVLSVSIHQKERLKIVWEDDETRIIIIRVMGPINHMYDKITKMVLN